ncbi:MAG: excinuclease ABC subunit UvrB [Candidatus Delongbacteria bacterium]|nr:excinuclease ABC subunit UvrB [Candidatus Delongbacteria bacterium]MDD4204749.1 excinuclease ABC subunit UvrB [Candidatus Delongbacteria bacterium]
MKKEFRLKSPFQPKGDQPEAIEQITRNFSSGVMNQTLLGVTGSGKTFTMANVIEKIGKPTLIISHNKTLAAQLYGELKSFFPDNAVEYFISYYDYYQPEAYLPSRDLYIEKTTSSNEEIEKLRLKATSSLISRNDVIIVASVSCIYGLGSPEDYKELSIEISSGDIIDRNKLFNSLIEMQYERNNYELLHGTFRIKGDIIDIHPAYDDTGIRLHTFGDEVEKIEIINYVSGKVLESLETVNIYPAKHFVVTQPKLQNALGKIEEEMKERVKYFYDNNMLVEAQRIGNRTKMDIEFLREMGFCPGIENYSRHLSGRKEGQRPYCLIDFFPDDFLLIIDESHASVPQIRGMYNGDRSRKQNLVDYGFRLPSALDNRPLKFNEFEEITSRTLYVSATPADYELERSEGLIIEQVVRPTGILDPVIIVKPSTGQVDDLMEEIRIVTARKEKVLVTTLTKRMSEDLTKFLKENGIKAEYLHSEILSLDRVRLIRELRLGKFDVLVGINLLREGLDLPEVSLIGILDADREGFLRDRRSLLQTSGRAARNVNGRVIFYADRMTDSIRNCIDEVNRRRAKQEEYNKINNITPRTVFKSAEQIMYSTDLNYDRSPMVSDKKELYNKDEKDIRNEIIDLESLMEEAAEKLQFEKAAEYRDRIVLLEKIAAKQKS